MTHRSLRGVGPQIEPADTTCLGLAELTADQTRRASVHVADRIAAEHPHPLDDLMPRLAGRQLATDPVIAAGLLELLDQLGIPRGNR